MKVIITDGGRAAAGFKGKTRDCVTRAVALATDMPYDLIYLAVNQTAATERWKKGQSPSSARTGVRIPTIRRFMEKLGWTWTPTMGIGTGCKVHLRDGELPMGKLVVNVSRHTVAVLDGVIHDTHDCSRNGTRCVYGYWRKA
jgi:hypothetical protein